MMMTDKLNSGLIESMKEKIPEGANLANLLMDILYIGKEAVYRRLRGEVPFTFTEAAVISQKLGVSLDQLIGANFGGNALFGLNIVHYADPVETYYAMIDGYAKIFRELKREPESELATSSNIIPQTLYMTYDMLSRFRLFKWMYQHDKIDCTNHCYDDLVLPEKLLQRQKELVDEAQQFESTCHIWDSMIFQYLVNDIKYFTKIHLLTEDNVFQLKTELLQSLDELEEIAMKGKFASGKDVHIYISNINFEATYSYAASKYRHVSMIRIYAINSITSRDTEVFGNLKEWIRSLRKFSTLISQSAEMQRIQFFKKQREIIAEL